MSASNAINVTFTEPILLLNGTLASLEETLDLGEDFNITISGPNEPYAFNVEAELTSASSVTFALEMLCSVEGGN